MEQDMDRAVVVARRLPSTALVAAGAVALLTAALLILRDASEPPVIVATEPILAQQQNPSPMAGDVRGKTAEPIPKELADAFEAATGRRAEFRVFEDGYAVKTRPTKIVELPFGRVLLTEVQIEYCHACAGAIGIYYLKEEAGSVWVERSWPRVVKGWGLGNPPAQWHLTDRFTAYPAIYASGGFMSLGVSTGGVTITELRPDGPITSDHIGTYYEEDGDPETKRPGCNAKGRIANIRKDRSFDVVVTGSVRAVDHYVKRDGRFVARKSINWNLPCGFSDDRGER